MSNALYKKSLQKMLASTFPDLSSATVRVALVLPTYVPDIASDEFLTDANSHIIGTPQALAGKSIVGGVFDADDVEFPAIATGSTVPAAILYVDTGVAGTSPLLAYLDTITGFPFNTSGVAIELRWSNGPYKIFSL